MQKQIHDQILNSVKTAEKIAGSDEILTLINDAAIAVITTIKDHGKVMIAGNGGVQLTHNI